MASNSRFLCCLSLIVVPILDSVTGRMMSIRQVLGMSSAVAGAAMLELTGKLDRPFRLSVNEMFNLLQPVFFGVGFWRTEHAVARHPDQSSRLVAAQYLTGFSVTTLIAYATNPEDVEFSELARYVSMPSLLFQVFWTGAIATAFTGYVETRAMEYLTAAETTVILMTEPLWATAVAGLVLGEKPGGAEFALGSSLIVAGCLLSSKDIELFYHRIPLKERANPRSIFKPAR